MGRKKIQISRITDERNRQVTFNKRKFGVMKKAYELSVLCDCEIALIIFSSSNKLYQYASTDMDKVLLKYTEYNEPHESLTNKNIIEALNKKEHKNGVMSPDSPEPETEYQLTPRTEAKYNKIEEDFQMMLQRNQTLNGQRVNMSSSNYSQPVSVPVNISYSDSALLQSSPQMAHTSISPRPSSSETDSAYPSGGILEMSNGYPNSSSPIGGSPSPGPSPGPGMSTSKHPKQHSPGPRANLRVVIPTASSSINTEEVSYSEHARSQSSLNTPVVALQTPGLSGYPGALTSFGAQDFSITSDPMTLSSMPWSTHQIASSLAHSAGSSGAGTSCMPHLAVPSSTPPPTAGSPLPVKIKSEPISPPREHHPHLSSSSLHHPQSHGQTLNLTHAHHPRPSSAGQVTPTPGSVTPTNLPSPTPSAPSAQGPGDYDPVQQLHKRQRLSDWAS
ncbi:myocyte enhancer factor 2 isoform X2 [Rhynchophorus ferrugineus]|uniref:MADS-box domain-containing protein n=1 Tax=Rhynchophorus ferrugineus TaxID=354439 RepID=A0A834MN37_RHYFE|nr:hypothetical protein GWI33_002811 [Rhynchophorus ferrugineus]